jgi:hypothetical protein
MHGVKVKTIYLLFATMKYIPMFHQVVMYIQLHGTVFVEKPTVH